MLHVLCRLLPVRDRRDRAAGARGDGLVRLRLSGRRARGRTDRRLYRDHPRWRLTDLHAWRAEKRRAGGVHVLRHHHAGEKAAADGEGVRRPSSYYASLFDIAKARVTFETVFEPVLSSNSKPRPALPWRDGRHSAPYRLSRPARRPLRG